MILKHYLLYPPATEILARCHDAILVKCSSGMLILIDFRRIVEIRMDSPTFSSGFFMLEENARRDFKVLREDSNEIIGFYLGEPTFYVAMLSDDIALMPSSSRILATPTLLKTRDGLDANWQTLLCCLSD